MGIHRFFLYLYYARNYFTANRRKTSSSPLNNDSNMFKPFISNNSYKLASKKLQELRDTDSSYMAKDHHD